MLGLSLRGRFYGTPSIPGALLHRAASGSHGLGRDYRGLVDGVSIGRETTAMAGRAAERFCIWPWPIGRRMVVALARTLLLCSTVALADPIVGPAAPTELHRHRWTLEPLAQHSVETSATTPPHLSPMLNPTTAQLPPPPPQQQLGQQTSSTWRQLTIHPAKADRRRQLQGGDPSPPPSPPPPSPPPPRTPTLVAVLLYSGQKCGVVRSPALTDTQAFNDQHECLTWSQGEDRCDGLAVMWRESNSKCNCCREGESIAGGESNPDWSVWGVPSPSPPPAA